MECMATITGDHVGYPRFQDLGNFSPRRKIFGGAKICTSVDVEFRLVSDDFVVFCHVDYCYSECHFTESQFTEGRFAECHYLRFIMQIVYKLVTL
jgi:hypothetical protein